MISDYLSWTGAIELLAFFVIGPALAIAIAYTAWRGKTARLSPERCRWMAIESGIIAVVLFGLARWIDTDFHSPLYFVQFACTVLSGLVFGVCVGCGASVLLTMWHWHRATRLR